VHLTEKEIEILAEKETAIAHNPGSNLKLGSGIAPVPELLSRGITVGLGTDSAASNNNLDMLEEMRLAALLHKGSRMDPTLITAEEAVAMATRESAAAVFLPDVGSIEEGKKADLLLWDLRQPHLTPKHNLVAHLVYAAQPSDIKMVMVNGTIVCRNGRLTLMDEDEIIFEAEQRARRLVGIA
jgi:5-methylthioadenosine/S-adenosylhomocysteine deaminase